MIRLVVVALIMSILLSGCAVGMALHGKKEPSLSDLRQGMKLEEVHFILRDYTPAVTYTEKGTRIEEYTIEMGNAPSAGRALGHLAMDVLTWGAWEIVGTPMEGLSSGSMQLTIIYNEDEEVSRITAGKTKEGI